MEFLCFEKSLRDETRITKNRWDAATSCKSKNIFVNGSRRGLLDWGFRTLIPESFRLFVPHEKSELSEEKTIQTILVAILRRYRKSLSLQLVAGVNLIFSTFARQQSALWSFSTSCLLDFRLSKSCCIFRKRASLTARLRSLDFRLAPQSKFLVAAKAFTRVFKRNLRSIVRDYG